MKRALWIWLGAGALLATWIAWLGAGEIACGGVLAFALAGVVGPAAGPRGVTAGVRTDSQGRPSAFTLSWGRETVTLDPGKTWLRADTYKWVTRGILEQPQSFHVASDGAVEINGEKIHPAEPDGVPRLEAEINKHFALPPGLGAAAAETRSVRPAAPAHRADRVEFHVKIDRLGHLMIESFRGEERFETGLRGLPSLIENGVMLPPAQLHVDPLQRHVELDGLIFECSETGAKRLQEALNTRYAPAIRGGGETQVEVRENAASPTGFDLQFTAWTAGSRAPVKGHLSQAMLDLLQDDARCGLLHHGVLVRLSPPYLLVRRRRADGGEEHIPELPDIQYLRAHAAQLQALLNHPLIRRGGRAASSGALAATQSHLREVRISRSLQNKLQLWMELYPAGKAEPEGRAFTHHNVAELQHAGLFQPKLDVSLSLDNQRLAILDRDSGTEEVLTLGAESEGEDLAQAGRLLTAALKPPASTPQEEPGAGPVADLAEAPRSVTPTAPPPPTASPRSSGETADVGPKQAEGPVALPASKPVANSPIGAGAAVASPSSAPTPGAQGPSVPGAAREIPPPFDRHSPLEVILGVFARLVERTRIPVQEVLLSLPPVFEDRRFEVLAFDGLVVESVLQLRSDAFTGFYLAHLHPDEVLLVYASRGRHIEFGPRRCELQAALSAEPDEFHGAGLLGLGQDAGDNFVFVVTPEYQSWAGNRTKGYADAAARFLTPDDLAVGSQAISAIWPEF